MISKSRYLAGLQCPKRLWNEVHRRELLPPVDAAQQAIFDQGHEVGEMAQGLRPGGLELARGRLDWQRAVDDTRAALGFRFPLYEAAFAHDGAACRVDILAPVGGDASRDWDLIEVKSGTSVKEIHCEDAAFQTWVLRGAGVPVRRSFVAHLDPDYVRDGALDVARLFAVVDVSDEVTKRLDAIPERVAALRAVEEAGAEPQVDIGPHCRAPHACPLVPLCWRHLPEESVFDLSRGAELAWQLYERGIVALTAIPEGLALSARQRIQVETARNGAARIERAALVEFLEKLAWPLHFLDFETFALALPPFDGVRPYQQIPFQFSLHVVDREGATPRAHGYLAPDAADRREELVRALRAAVGERGSIVAYNAGFEKRVIAECAGALPEHAEWLEGLGARFVDLLDPFRAFDYYHPSQRGSASMKVVLPALTGEGYEALEIREGAIAALEFLRSTRHDTSEGERDRIRRALLTYCARDTAGMVEIVGRLRELVES